MEIIKYRALNKNYELINENELLDILLKNRGVDNPKKLLNVSHKDIHDGKLLKNMDRALNMLHWHIENNSKIHIIFDVDNDGITSGTKIYKYIKNINSNIKITYSMNEDKKHGIILKSLDQYNFDLLIVPDAGSDDIKQCQVLKEERDVDILIIDHHTMKQENKYAIVINCQDGQYPNKTLSGAGVVYKFIKEYDKKYGYRYAEEDLDLVAMGIIGDSMDLRNYETRYFALQGINNVTNSFIKEFLIKNKVENNSVNFDFVGWKVAPLINAVTRVGTPEEKIDLIEAFLGIKRTKEYQPRRKSKNDPKPDIETQTLQQVMIRESTNIKARQDRLVEKNMESIIEKIESDNLINNKIIIVDGTGILEKTFTGLVANKLSNKYKRPIIILKKMKEEKNKDGIDTIIYGGSFRNYDLFPIESLQNFLLELGTFIKVAGHENAGGFEIEEDKIQETLSKANEILKDVDIEDVYLVDYEIPVGRLKERHISQIGKLADIWGNTLKKPLFAVTDITIPITDIQLIGDKRNIIKFEKSIGDNKIVFVKKFAGEEVYNRMILKNHKGLSKRSSSKVKLDVVGEFVLNKWNENEYPQVEIIDFNVGEAKEFRF